MSDPVVIYTDGACKHNPGPGGWGALLMHPKKHLELKGAEAHTTNNQMELMAAIQALEALQQPTQVVLYTDSTYVRDGITKWMDNWKRRNWKTAAGKPVKNQDLWQRLDAATGRHEIDWRWVKGHSGDPGNERADELANEAVAALRSGGG